MTQVRTSAELRLNADGVMTVEPFIRLTGNSRIHCFTYDHAPVLVVIDANVRLSVSVPDVHHVTGEDVQRARELAETVSRYVAELEHRMASGKDAAEGQAA